MVTPPDEWLKQAQYDLDTAKYMFQGGRYFYTVFMCHLALEKALKGLYVKRLNEMPPKVHNLVFLLDRANVARHEPTTKFLIRLNEASVATRYPENLAKMQEIFSKDVVGGILKNTEEALQWIEKQY